MPFQNQTSLADAFWSYLNYQLYKSFKGSEYVFQCISPSEVSIDSLLKKDTDMIPVRLILNRQQETIEFIGTLILGSVSKKAYLNVTGADVRKCFPKSEISEWIIIDKSQNKIVIRLR